MLALAQRRSNSLPLRSNGVRRAGCLSAWDREDISCGLVTWSQRERAPQLGRKRSDVQAELVDDVFGPPALRKTNQHRQAGLAFDEGGDLAAGTANTSPSRWPATAWHTPRRPEVQHVDLAAVIAARHPAILESWKSERRRQTADQRRRQASATVAPGAAARRRRRRCRLGSAVSTPVCYDRT